MRKIAVFCVLGLVTPVYAIVVQTNSIAEAAPVGLDWSYVYNYKGSSAVAVGGGWLLTAGHVADDGADGTVTGGTNVYNQQEIVYCPDTDLALVRFDKDFGGYYGLYTTENPTVDLPGLEVLMVGFGNTGTVSTAYFTDSGSGGVPDTRRWGSQIIDRTLIKRYDSNGAVGYTKNFGFLMEFDLGNTSHEAGTGVGDSGGGVFYNDGSVWKLAGVMTSRSGGPQYTGTFAISMPHYADWIADTIPEPAAMGLMGFATVGLFLSRAKRRRNKLAGRRLLPVRRGDEPLCDRFCAEEEADTRWEGRVDANYLARQELINASLLPGRIVISVKTGRTKAIRALRMGICNVLDAFLEKISWDQMVSLFSRRK